MYLNESRDGLMTVATTSRKRAIHRAGRTALCGKPAGAALRKQEQGADHDQVARDSGQGEASHSQGSRTAGNKERVRRRLAADRRASVR